MLCTLQPLPDGGVRALVEDVRYDAETGTWGAPGLYVFIDYTREELSAPHGLSAEKLRAFGYVALNRLLELNRVF